MYTILIAAVAPAFAVSTEVALQTGFVASRDPNFALFSNTDLFSSTGVRAGYALKDHLAVTVGWRTGGTGLFVGQEDEEYYGDVEPLQLHTAFHGNQFTAGLKADAKVATWFYPYVALQGAGLLGTVRFDDDLDEDDNAGQVKRSGFTGGVIATGGASFPIHLGRGSAFAIAPYSELGYSALAPLKFGDVGTLRMGGLSGELGIALQF